MTHLVMLMAMPNLRNKKLPLPPRPRFYAPRNGVKAFAP
jgi:hypothetical protein